MICNLRSDADLPSLLQYPRGRTFDTHDMEELGISMTIRSFTKRSFARNYPNKLKDAFLAQEGVATQ